MADLRNILLSAISDQEEFEISTFVIKRISDIAQSNSYIRFVVLLAYLVQNVVSKKEFCLCFRVFICKC